jgi:HAD superfamily hydrolase (TIGR01549 family)
MYNCIIFDVDGTMIVNEEAVFSSYQKAIFDEFGRYFTPEEVKRAYSVPTLEALKRLGFKNIEEAEQKYHRYLMEAFKHVEPYPGIIDVLEYLKQKGIVLGVVTSRNKSEVTRDVCFQGLVKYFDYVVCASDTDKHKPDPEPLVMLLQRADCEPGKAIYIGDTLFDYKCARDAGVDFALACWGAKSREGIEAKYFLEAPGEILNISAGS